MQVQNIIIKDGVQRFEENLLVSVLIDNFEYEGSTGLNALSRYYQINNIDEKHYEQITQLIGYSVGGFGGLSTTSDETWIEVVKKVDKL